MTETEPSKPQVTVTCELCEQTFTGNESGAGSAAWKLGLHKRNAHGVEGKKARRKRGEPSEDELAAGGARSVLAGAQAVAAEIGQGRGNAPTAAQLAAGLGRGLAIASIFAANLAADTDPTIGPGEVGARQKDALIDELALTPKAATDVMAPIARALSGTKANAKYGRAVVDNVDVVASILEIGTLGWRWRSYFRDRAFVMAQMRGEINPAGYPVTSPPDLTVAPPPGSPPPATPSPAGPGGGPASVVQGGMVTTPPPSGGRLATPEDVKAALAARENGGSGRR